MEIKNIVHGKQAVIIGGTSGIGFAIAQAALSKGARVAIASSSKSRVDQAVSDLGDLARGFVVDVH